MVKTHLFHCKRWLIPDLSLVKELRSFMVHDGLPYGSMVKESACNAKDAGDSGLIPGLGRSPGTGMESYSSILAWKIPWTEEPGGLQSMGSQRVEND